MRKKLIRQHKFATIGMVIVAALLIFLLSYYAGNGFSLNDSLVTANEDCRVMIDQPFDNQEFFRTDTIRVTGSVWGGIPQKVIVWEQSHNVPIYATISGTSFGVSFYGSDLSNGEHVICMQAQTNDGRWTDIETRLVLINNYQPQQSQGFFGFPLFNTYNSWSDTYLPEPMATVFRPVEEVLEQTVVYITGGTSGDDLNGDNVPDELQQSPAAPRYNPFGAPVTLFFVYAVIAAIILVVIYYVIRPYLQRKQEAQQKLHQDKGWRKWKLQMQSLTNKQIKKRLRNETRQRKAMEETLKKREKELATAKKQRPIKIYTSRKKT